MADPEEPVDTPPEQEEEQQNDQDEYAKFYLMLLIMFPPKFNFQDDVIKFVSVFTMTLH